MTAPEPNSAAATLRAHLDDCARARGHWRGVSGALQYAHAWLRPRLVSTLLVLLALMAGLQWLA